MIDHIFHTLEDDEGNKKSNIRILLEIILHIIVLAQSLSVFSYVRHCKKIAKTHLFK